MAHPLWPLYDLRLASRDAKLGELVLRLPAEAELSAFVALASQGIHPPDEMPFSIPWTDMPSPERERSSYQFYMSTRASWSVEAWTLTLGLWLNGEPAGFQDLRAQGFPKARTVATGSWLGQAFQGRGIGRLMRQMVLSLAFDHLGAEIAETEAFLDNPASNRVSLAVGYRPNGFGRITKRDGVGDTQRFRMTRDDWRARPRPVVTVEGLEVCRELFGIS